MSNDNKDKKQPTGDYAVGYAKPPRHGQFRKGQSGNPNGSKGRKKRKAPTKDELRDDFFEMMEAPVPVKVNGIATTMKAKKALMRQILAKALAGDFRCQKLLLEKFEGNLSVEEAIREATESLPSRVTIEFVESDGDGRPKSGRAAGENEAGRASPGSAVGPQTNDDRKADDDDSWLN